MFVKLLSVTQNVYRQNIWWRGTRKWRVIGKKQAWPTLIFYHNIDLEGLNKNGNSFSQKNQRHGLYSKWVPPDTGQEVLPAVSWFRQSIASLSPRRSRVHLRSVYVGFVMDKVLLRQIFLRVFRFFPVTITVHLKQPKLHINNTQINK